MIKLLDFDDFLNQCNLYIYVGVYNTKFRALDDFCDLYLVFYKCDSSVKWRKRDDILNDEG